MGIHDRDWYKDHQRKTAAESKLKSSPPKQIQIQPKPKEKNNVLGYAMIWAGLIGILYVFFSVVKRSAG